MTEHQFDKSKPYSFLSGCPDGYHKRKTYKTKTGKKVPRRCVRSITKKESIKAQQLQKTGPGTGAVGTQQAADPQTAPKTTDNQQDPNAQPADPAQAPPGSPQAQQQQAQQQQAGQDELKQMQKNLDALKKQLGR